MNNNNLYNTNNFIGITHNDYFKTASNALSKAINSLELNSSNYTSNVSNILNTNSSNYTYNVSNILNTNSSNYIQNTSNYIITRYDPMIETKSENVLLPIPATLNHTYINNSNILGEIRFWCKSTNDFIVVEPLGVPDYRVKIDIDGKLKVYYTYDPLINLTFFNGWVDVGNSIAALNASEANLGIALGAVEIALGIKITQLEVKVNQVVLGLQASLPRSQAIINMTNEIATQLAENTAANTSWLTFRTNLNSFFLTGTTSYLSQALSFASVRIATNPVILSFLGIGGIAFAAFIGAAQNLSYINVYNSLIESKIETAYSSNWITSQRRDELLSSNNDLILDNYISYCSNIYNATLAQGFINSNITGQQYIPNLKCETLDLNTGNITNINGIAANELIANGKIKQNGILLDNTYLTSNHLYNLAYTYTAERQYPSKLYTTTTQQDTVSLLGKLVYHQTLYLNNQTIAYGSGIYEVYSSSSYDTPTTKDRLFNFNTTETTTSPRWAISLYNSGTGNYQGDNSIVSGYFGDWIILKLPQPILLTRYRIYQRSDFLTKAPAEWKVYGSNDGITFTEITEASQTTRLTSYTGGYYEKSLNPSFTTLYQYIGYTFKSLLSTSGQTDLSFSELQIFGKEIISNTITSSIYATSNAVKNIIIYDTPVVCKHFAFYITITTPIVINGKTYYKYDIDLRQYTKLGYIDIGSQSGDSYRIFKLRACYGSMYFSTLVNGLPNVVYSDIFMSMKANPTANLGVAGLNICSIGSINNPRLDIVPSNNLFFMRNGANSIDYITVVSTNVADVRCFIEDMIS